MKNEKEIESIATNWVIDYKPWDENLDFRLYAQHGFKEGYKRALIDVGNREKTRDYIAGYDSGYKQSTSDSRALLFVEKYPILSICISIVISIIIYSLIVTSK